MSASDPAAKSSGNKGGIRAAAPAMGLAALRRSTLFYPLLGLAVVCLIMVFASDSFLSVNNLSNVGRQVSINALIAVGMTFVILTGGIDLSVGSVMALSGTLAAGLMIGGVPGRAGPGGVPRGRGGLRGVQRGARGLMGACRPSS